MRKLRPREGKRIAHQWLWQKYRQPGRFPPRQLSVKRDESRLANKVLSPLRPGEIPSTG